MFVRGDCKSSAYHHRKDCPLLSFNKKGVPLPVIETEYYDDEIYSIKGEPVYRVECQLCKEAL